MAQACSVKVCLAFAAPGKDVCAIHEKHPDYQPTVVQTETTTVPGWTRQVIHQECRTCAGQGEVTCEFCQHTNPCNRCNGEGLAQTVVYVHEDGREISAAAFRELFPVDATA